MLVLCSFTRFQIDDWLLEREKKGIKVFTKKSKWGRLKDSKATMLIPATKVDDVVKFLTDFDNYPSWMPRCRSARVLARLSENEFIGYTVWKCPWPVADRDCVMSVNIQKDPATGVVLITEMSELGSHCGTIFSSSVVISSILIVFRTTLSSAVFKTSEPLFPPLTCPACTQLSFGYSDLPTPYLARTASVSPSACLNSRNCGAAYSTMSQRKPGTA